MILGFASALNYLDYFLIIYRDRSQKELSCEIFGERTKIVYESKNRFFGTVKNIGDVQFTFLRNKDGKVDKVIAKIGFGILPFERIG
jgi:hypothetical protein